VVGVALGFGNPSADLTASVSTARMYLMRLENGVPILNGIE